MITAQQARDLFKQELLTIERIGESVEMMASKGYNFWATDLNKLIIPDDIVTELNQLGYSVEILDQHNTFRISW